MNKALIDKYFSTNQEISTLIGLSRSTITREEQKGDFTVVTADALKGSYKVMNNIIEAFERGLYPIVHVLGESQHDKRNLYPRTSKSYKDKSIQPM